MPRIGLYSQKLGQETSNDDEDGEEAELFQGCLTQGAADYDHFAKPGAVLGFGIGVARNAGIPSDEKERNDFLEPAVELSKQFWKQGKEPRHVIKGLIDTYGCEPVKTYISKVKPLRDEEAEMKNWEKRFRGTP